MDFQKRREGKLTGIQASGPFAGYRGTIVRHGTCAGDCCLFWRQIGNHSVPRPIRIHGEARDSCAQALRLPPGVVKMADSLTGRYIISQISQIPLTISQENGIINANRCPVVGLAPIAPRQQEPFLRAARTLEPLCRPAWRGAAGTGSGAEQSLTGVER